MALPGGGGVKAAIKGYRIAIKTGTAKKVGPDGRYINKYIAYTAGVAPASQPRFALVVVINDPQAGKYYDERQIQHQQRWVNHYQNRLIYERAMLDESGGVVTRTRTRWRLATCATAVIGWRIWRR